MPESPRYLEALNQALVDEMARDERVALLGVDVGEAGGVYGVTRGLYERFPDRVIDTPIAEAGVLGAAVGAARRPRAIRPPRPSNVASPNRWAALPLSKRL
jgi:pyruvate/2-oxoglutarate/acetoin dehydrogenase E1 component